MLPPASRNKIRSSTAILLAACATLMSCKERLPDEMQKSLDATVAYVERYRASRAVIPTRDEFFTWSSTNRLLGVVDYKPIEGTNRNEYCIYIWRGERMLIFSSKDKVLRKA